DALRSSGDRCSICGRAAAPPGFRDQRLYCHERWRYNDRSRVATLVGFQVLCAGCNAVAHMGRTGLFGYLPEALAHLAEVNGISLTAAREVYHRAMSIWEARSATTWRVAVSAALLKRYPALKALEELANT